jgi:transposase
MTHYVSKNIDHLGLVSGMIDELGLVSYIDSCLEKESKDRVVSYGTLCKALILNGLGFTQRTLYLVPQFFEDKAVSHLLGFDIDSSQLNDTNMGRCLDAIWDYGCTNLYGNFASQACSVLGLNGKSCHLDSTDFHVEGNYNSSSSEVEENVIHLRPGYSRDHRPDCNQVVLNLIVENQAGIALHMEGLSGNVSDKTAFRNTLSAHIGSLQNVHHFDYVVMDSAGYTEESLKTAGKTLKWISRVPETLKEAKEAVGKREYMWHFLAEGYQYASLSSNYGDIEQRWLLVFSEAAYQREMESLRKNYQQKSWDEMQLFEKLCKKAFECEKDAQQAHNDFLKSCKYISINDLEIRKVGSYLKKGKPKKGQQPDKYHFYLQGTLSCNTAEFAKKAQAKGRFIIATNEMDKAKLPDSQILIEYKGQAKVEKGFRFLKDPQFVASTFFVKKPQRVEALLFIMTLCLTVYAAIEYRIRQQLLLNQQTFPNQVGKQVQKPSARWVFTTFSGIHYLNIDNNALILNLKNIHITIIDLLGYQYRKYYFLE